MASDSIDTRDYINYGLTNFDHIFSSLLSVFQIINSDTWSGQLMNFMDVDIPIFGAFYCLMMIIVGQFFLMNLILAVIIFAFIKTQKRELEDEIIALHGDDGKENPLATSVISHFDAEGNIILPTDGNHPTKRSRTKRSLSRMNSRYSRATSRQKSPKESEKSGTNLLKSSHKGILVAKEEALKRKKKPKEGRI